jgi:hypothetical protein
MPTIFPIRPVPPGRVEAAGKHAIKRGFDEALHPRDTHGEFSSKGSSGSPSRKSLRLDRAQKLKDAKPPAKPSGTKTAKPAMKSERAATEQLHPSQQQMLKALTVKELNAESKRRSNNALIKRAALEELTRRGAPAEPVKTQRKPPTKPTGRREKTVGALTLDDQMKALTHSDLEVESTRARNSAEKKQAAQRELDRRDGKAPAPGKPTTATEQLRPDQQRMLKALTHSELSAEAGRRSNSALLKQAAAEELERRDRALRRPPVKARRKPPKKPTGKKV